MYGHITRLMNTFNRQRKRETKMQEKFPREKLRTRRVHDIN